MYDSSADNRAEEEDFGSERRGMPTASNDSDGAGPSFERARAFRNIGGFSAWRWWTGGDFQLHPRLGDAFSAGRFDLCRLKLWIGSAMSAAFVEIFTKGTGAREA